MSCRNRDVSIDAGPNVADPDVKRMGRAVPKIRYVSKRKYVTAANPGGGILVRKGDDSVEFMEVLPKIVALLPLIPQRSTPRVAGPLPAISGVDWKSAG